MAHDPAQKNWDGSKSIKQRFHLRIDPTQHKTLLGEVRAYVRSLRDSVLVFTEVFAPAQSGAFSAYPQERQAELREWAMKLPRTGVLSTLLPALMAIRLRFPVDANAYLNALRLFENYAFRVYRWESRRANAGQTRLFRLGFEIFHSQTTLDALSREVRLKALSYCSNQSFADGFKPSDDNNFYYWSGIRYFLYEYELHLSKNRGVKMSWEDFEKSDYQRTIEHILPQTPTDAYWTDRFDQAACKKYTHYIGNLVLTFDNSVYGNKPYPDKRGELKSLKPCYATSNIFSEQDIAKQFDEWNMLSLDKRGEMIRDWALDR